MNKLKTHILNRFSFGNKHPFIIPVVTFMALFFVTCAGFVVLNGQTIGANDSKVVSLYVDGQTRIVPTRAQTVGDVLAQANIELREGDLVEPVQDSQIVSQNFNINIYRAKPVTVVDESGKVKRIKVAETDPAMIAKEVGLKVYPEDRVEFASPQEVLRDGVLGEKVVIDRAVPVKLNLFGETYDIRTHAVTVADLALERGITFNNQSILPAPDTRLKAGEVIFITQPGKEITRVEEEIPVQEEIIEDANLPSGATKVRAEGSPGRKVVIYDVASDGNRVPLQEVVIVAPVKRVVVKGTKTVTPSRSMGSSIGGSSNLLHSLRKCETGGNYQTNTGNGYHGAYQFSASTWRSMGTGYAYAYEAPPSVQDDAALRLAQRSGFHSQFPGCSNKLNLPAYP